MAKTFHSFGSLVDLVIGGFNGGIPKNAINLEKTDLRTLKAKEQCGFYLQQKNANITPDLNYPSVKAGLLLVLESPTYSGTDGGVTQVYIPYDNGGVYVCVYYNNTWLEWKKLAFEADVISKLQPIGYEHISFSSENPSDIGMQGAWERDVTRQNLPNGMIVWKKTAL